MANIDEIESSISEWVKEIDRLIAENSKVNGISISPQRRKNCLTQAKNLSRAVTNLIEVLEREK